MPPAMLILKLLPYFSAAIFQIIDDGMRITAVLFLKTSTRFVGGAFPDGKSQFSRWRIAGISHSLSPNSWLMLVLEILSQHSGLWRSLVLIRHRLSVILVK
jgi:hypothetical protein